MTRPPRSRVRVAARDNTMQRRIWLIAGIALAFAAIFAAPALAGTSEERASESLIAFAATTSVGGVASEGFGAPSLQSEPVPTPHELQPDRLIVAGTLGVGTATILVVALSMLDGRIRDRGFHRSRG